VNAQESLQPDIIEVAVRWLLEGRQAALATVISTWGSSPMPVGSQLVADGAGNFAGSVSGGCIEGAVIEEALACMRDRQPRTLKIGVGNDRAWEVGLACGGDIHIFIQPLG